DAENIDFPNGSFDFVWSWGVIHHSSRTARIVRQISRVLSASGECRVMVYNRASTGVAVTFLKDYLLKGGFLRLSFEDTLYGATDGFSARYYVPEHFEDLFRAFFQNVENRICGQDADAVPLPRQLREVVLRVLPDSYVREAQSRRGGFLFLTASSPVQV